MIETHEPRDGDFIAYIEQLQKESAARLLGEHHALTELDKNASASKPGGHFFGSRKPADLKAAAAANPALAQLARESATGLLYAALAIFIGVLLTLYWLFATASIVLLVIGIGLLAWGVQRIKRVVRKVGPRRRQAQALVTKVFTPPVKK